MIMAVYYCRGCNRCLNLSDEFLYPSSTFFDAGNSGSLSFRAIDESDFRQQNRSEWRPYFETVNSWGFQRRRTRLTCAACGKVMGHIYNDAPNPNAPPH